MAFLFARNIDTRFEFEKSSILQITRPIFWQLTILYIITSHTNVRKYLKLAIMTLEPCILAENIARLLYKFSKYNSRLCEQPQS